MLYFRGLFQLIVVAIALPLSGCSTALLNSNQTDLASTLDDLAVAQIVLNLVRTNENPWAIPSQVQFNTSIVQARTNITPSYTDPLGAAIATAHTVAQSVTNSTTKTSPNQSATISLTAENTSTWNASPIQYSEALKRLQLLYQYGTQFITANEFTCAYPIPRKPEKTDQKSDLQVIADLLKNQSSDKSKLKLDKSNSKEADKSTPKELNVYVLGVACNGSIRLYTVAHPANNYTAAAENNPDLAFLIYPTCVLCIISSDRYSKSVEHYLKTEKKIYLNNYSDHELTFKKEDEKKTKYYVSVNINVCLAPDEPDSKGHESNYEAKNDWLFVLEDGVVPEVQLGAPKETNCPGDRRPPRRVGGANGYSVYTTNDKKFAEFVLAVREATLQNPQIQKAGAPSTPLVQTVTGG